MKLSLGKLELLMTIYEISRNNAYKIAPTKEIINTLTAKKQTQPQAVRKMLYILHVEGLISNPLIGGWELTPRGKECLRSVSALTNILT